MDLGLKGKVALVTGGGDGIGRRTILTFAEEGANVVVDDIVAEKAERVAEEARALGVEAMAIAADVTNTGAVADMANKAIARFGCVDILVNGAFAIDRKFFTQSTRQDWEPTITVCLYGTMNCTRALINQMVTRKYGKVISIISDAARVAEPNLPAYSAAKAGIMAFSRSLAKEVGRHNINVNCVSPGATLTDWVIHRRQAELDGAKTEEERAKVLSRQAKALSLYPIGRFGEPEDIANMIVFLASDRARHVTGQVVSVNGGYTMI